MSDPLLGNMQNRFDALFGDSVGQSDQRFLSLNLSEIVESLPQR